MKNSSARIGIGIATLTSLIYGGILGAAKWGALGAVLGALVGGALAIIFVWVAGVLLIALFSIFRKISGLGSMAYEYETDRYAGTALRIAPWIVIILTILGIYFQLK
jgi:hypothetical protein